MKSTVAALFAVSVSASGAVVDGAVKEAFGAFMEKYGKSYDTSDELANRAQIFADNLERVNKRNEEHVLLGGTGVHGITKFMDLTAEEFKAQYLTYKPRNESDVTRVTPPFTARLADSIDWRTRGAVTPVKDQGQCGSCWAFSATEAIESYAFLSGKYSLQELSAQQINSCDKVDLGCNGGNTESAYEYVEQAGGLTTEAAYPYTSGTGITGTCKTSTPAVTVAGYDSISQGESNLQSALNSGPASICVAADSFQTYSSGILRSCPGSIDHCVQAVGYDSGENYWLVRNSWGTDWGESGYIRVNMGSDLCHISDDVTVPTF